MDSLSDRQKNTPCSRSTQGELVTVRRPRYALHATLRRGSGAVQQYTAPAFPDIAATETSIPYTAWYRYANNAAAAADVRLLQWWEGEPGTSGHSE
jgi:hypothetical protein